MIEKEFNDGIYTKSTAKREKCTRFMLHNMIFRANRWEYFNFGTSIHCKGQFAAPPTIITQRETFTCILLAYNFPIPCRVARDVAPHGTGDTTQKKPPKLFSLEGFL